ncbi:MAG TPA: NADPH-dependent F420 reductase [Pyrinomonadaceae bacterium]|nr:NADPH-dependent F420 reductase [Pyrinomonadaceae bacterium]
MTPSNLEIAIIGGTGKEGRGIAFRWAFAGANVTIGSREFARAAERARSLNQILGEDRIRHAKNEEAISHADIVVLAVPYDCAATTLTRYAKNFRPESILVDATVPLIGDRPTHYLESDGRSGSERLQPYVAPSIHLVAAFKTISAYALFDPMSDAFADPTSIPQLDCDDFVASDSESAKSTIIEAMKLIEGLRPLDAGPLENSRSIERLTILIIALNRLNSIKTGRYRIVGI